VCALKNRINLNKEILCWICVIFLKSSELCEAQGGNFWVMDGIYTAARDGNLPYLKVGFGSVYWCPCGPRLGGFCLDSQALHPTFVCFDTSLFFLAPNQSPSTSKSTKQSSAKWIKFLDQIKHLKKAKNRFKFKNEFLFSFSLDSLAWISFFPRGLDLVKLIEEVECGNCDWWLGLPGGFCGQCSRNSPDKPGTQNQPEFQSPTSTINQTNKSTQNKPDNLSIPIPKNADLAWQQTADCVMNKTKTIFKFPC
jgi:hypothetical protein